MPSPSWLTFFPRTFPSANMALVHGPRPILIDTGFGSDLDDTEALLRSAGAPPETLALIVTTHYHSDHIGGVSGLQSRYGLPVAAHTWDAALINRRDPEACAATWLDQPVEPYRVTHPLAHGDELDTGLVRLRVLHTPGHSLGHISLYAPDHGVLICGDALHGDDVAWINVFREGIGALDRSIETLEKLAELDVRWACSGHSLPMEDPQVAIGASLRRYRSWEAAPEKMAWHGAKRIFAYHLMLVDGLPEAEVTPYLLTCPWLHDYARHVFALPPEAFIDVFVAEMLRSGAAGWRAGRLVALTPYNAPRPGWARGPTRVREWPTLS